MRTLQVISPRRTPSRRRLVKTMRSVYNGKNTGTRSGCGYGPLSTLVSIPFRAACCQTRGRKGKTMRTFWLVAGCVLGLLTCARPVVAQTMVEAGAAGSAAATAATGAKGAGTGIAGAFESLGKTLNPAPEPAQRIVKVTNAAAPAKPK